MKKNKLCLLLVLSVLLAKSFADDNNNSFLRGLHSSSGVVIENSRIGAYGDLGFLLLKKEQWDIRNNIGLHGYGSNDYGYIGISEKISIGGWFEKSDLAFRSYGSIIILTCAYGGNGKTVFSLPLSMDVLMSGGFEIMYTVKQGFFIEYGGGYRFTLPFESGLGYAYISTGIRTYLK